jgi:hypothetical protein
VRTEFDEKKVVQTVWRLYALMWDSSAGCEGQPFTSLVIKTMDDMREALKREEQLDEQVRLIAGRHNKLDIEHTQLRCVVCRPPCHQQYYS